MNKVLRATLIMALLTMLLTGCHMSQEVGGTEIGSVVGYTIVDQPEYPIAGGVAGGYIGNRLAD